MKLRILGNKLRYRLTQGEVQALESGESVVEKVIFPGGNEMTYSVKPGKRTEMEVSFSNNEILLEVPSNELNDWSTDQREGIYRNWENNSFEVALEKDFQCLHKRPNEDESDNYPNPRK